MPPPWNRDGFRLAVVCALPEERRAVEQVIEHYNKPSYGKADGDKNFYLYGELGGQPIVLTTQADKGPIAATETARMIQSSFRRIELVFLVGITGGALFRADGSQTGVRLGDVIVSQSMRQHDFGKQMENTFATATAFPYLYL
jgi:nucleoside phosphorylase